MTIGLDINENVIKLIELKDSAQGAVLTNYSIVKYQGSITETLRKIWTDLKFLEKNVYVCISGLSVCVRRLLLPNMSDSELKEALKWEVKNFVPFPIENTLIKSFRIGKTADKIDLMVVAVEEKAMRQMLSQIEEAGLKIAGVTITSLALAEILKKNPNVQPAQTVCLIDLGSQLTSIGIFKNFGLQFTREISLGESNFVKSFTGMIISDKWNLTLTSEQAQALIEKFGIPEENTTEVAPEGIPLANLFLAIKPVLSRFINEILRSFEYYKEQSYGSNIDKIILSGEMASLKNLDKYLSKELGIAVEIVDPLQNIKIELEPAKAETLRANALKLDLALGLALGKTSDINLLKSEETKIAPNLANTVKVSPPTFFITLAILILLGIIYHFYLGNRYAYYQNLLTKRQITASQVKILTQTKAISQQISNEESDLRETLLKLNALIPGGVILNELHYNNPDKTITLSGTARDTGLIGDCIKNIEDSSRFKNTELKEIKKVETASAPEGARQGINFTLLTKIE